MKDLLQNPYITDENHSLFPPSIADPQYGLLQ